ncbi:Global transcription factor group E4, putative isoform 2 [Hibiscus syriacus]|uniref:Global transcription factor group E4, putative isoform 2 n=1 Tax=Hibiscus syriacus TaxID=106335 RepID=A0A6A3AWL5_HIBSY|nr:Global transcription factor group E4, putative isoform 2 [Hibiscus syriacus]
MCMASGTVDGEGKDGEREKQRYSENKVYTRKVFKDSKKNNLLNASVNNIDPSHDNNNNNNIDIDAVKDTAVTATAADPNGNGNGNNDDNNRNQFVQIPAQPFPLEFWDSVQQQPGSCVDTAISDDCSSLKKQPYVAGAVKPSSENQVKINLASRSKQEVGELRRKLVSELDLVRNLVKRIEAKEQEISDFGNSLVPLDNAVDYGFNRVKPEMASVGILQESVKKSRPLNRLNIYSLENSQGAIEYTEKEKRTPKANQFYRNSEFLLAKDKFPPAESNKKLKLNGKKQGGGEFTNGFFMVSLNIPWIWGTVKSRLSKNWYKSPREFAEDVRLTFQNAMTYNPKGQDVHVMAEQLSKIFEGKWASIEADYIRDMRLAIEYEVSLRMPAPRKAHSMLPPPIDTRGILDRSMTFPVNPSPKLIATTPLGWTPAPKKPKAKDPYKRDMTYEEKQKLSTNLQSLPLEKLDNIVQIIKKRNAAFLQHDDEIEVDIDSVDSETLWELDRFVTNYKKSLSKNKRKAELFIQARAEAEQSLLEKLQIVAPVSVEVPKETTTNEQNVSISLAEGKQGDATSRLSSSSSSSSDSGSSSSDSDSESSSASGSDAGHSPGS